MKWICPESDNSVYCDRCHNGKPIVDPTYMRCMISGLPQKLIRYRHPLEAAILREIAKQLKIHTSYIIGSHVSVLAIHKARYLWSILKEGRKNEKG